MEDTELYKRYRPNMFKEVVGQPDAIRMLTGLVKNDKVPRAILFTGPSGCGKTTLARILRHKVGCTESANFVEANCADFNGIDMIRDIRRRMHQSALGGNRCRVWLVDEAHELTKAAQNAFLKILEDTPKHVYFFLATTEPNKLLKTVRTRCTEVKCNAVSTKCLTELVESVAEKEDKEFTDEVIEKLVDVADGSARKALVLLHQILDIEGEEDQLTAISASVYEKDAIELCRLFCKKGVKWPEVAKMIKAIDPDDNAAEGIRRLILSYFSKILLGGGVLSARAFIILDVMRDNFYDSGKAGLFTCCYEIVVGNDK